MFHKNQRGCRTLVWEGRQPHCCCSLYVTREPQGQSNSRGAEGVQFLTEERSGHTVGKGLMACSAGKAPPAAALHNVAPY